MLALPPEALRLVDWPPFARTKLLREYIGSVSPVPAVTLHVAYENSSAQRISGNSRMRIRTDLPVRHIDIFQNESAANVTSTVISACAVGEFTAYWRRLLGGDTSPISLSDEHHVSVNLLSHARHHLARLATNNETLVPNSPPTGAAVKFWHAAWHVYKASFDWTDVTRRMLRPMLDSQLFVVGAAFASAHVQTFAEGALETVDRMVEEYFS